MHRIKCETSKWADNLPLSVYTSTRFLFAKGPYILPIIEVKRFVSDRIVPLMFPLNYPGLTVVPTCGNLKKKLN